MHGLGCLAPCRRVIECPYDGIPSVDKIADESAYAAKQAAKKAARTIINSDAWNSPLARMIVPDYITLGGSIQSSSGVYASEEGTFTLLLRGEDPGLYFNTTTGFGGTVSVGTDFGGSLGGGYYLGDPRLLSSKTLGGWQVSGSFSPEVKLGVGVGVSGGIDVGLNDKRQPTTISYKIGVSAGVGVATPINGTLGGGSATPAIPIIKFTK